MSQFFENVDRVRMGMGQSWPQFIKTINISYPTYLNWRRGALPKLETVVRVAKVLNKKPTELLG